MLALIYITKSLDFNLYDKSLIFLVMRQNRVKWVQLPPWLSREILTDIKARDNLKQQAKTDLMAWSENKKVRNQVTNNIRYSKRKYYEGNIDKHKDHPKLLWRTLKNAINLNTKSSVPGSINIENTIINDQKQIADAFNAHFSTVAQRLTNNNVQNQRKSTDDVPKKNNHDTNFVIHQSLVMQSPKVYWHSVIKKLKDLTTLTYNY